MGVLAPGSAHARPSGSVCEGEVKKIQIHFLAISGNSSTFRFLEKSKCRRRKKEEKNAINSGHLVP